MLSTSDASLLDSGGSALDKGTDLLSQDPELNKSVVPDQPEQARSLNGTLYPHKTVLMISIIALSILAALPIGALLYEGLEEREQSLTPFEGSSIHVLQLTPSSEEANTLSMAIEGLSETVKDMGSLRLQFATYGTKVPAKSVRLVSESGDCGFLSAALTLEDLQFVTLKALDVQKCTSTNGQRVPWSIEITTNEVKPVALVVMKSQVTPAAPYFSIKSGSEILYPVGFFSESNRKTAITHFRKYELLAHMWGIPQSKHVVFFIFASLCLIIAIGAALFAISYINTHLYMAALLIMSLGLCSWYVIITPPFQAPDEIVHFMTYLSEQDDKNKLQNVAEFAEKGHYSRLVCQFNEKFAQPDIFRKDPRPMHSRTRVIAMNGRSAITGSIWNAYQNSSLKFLEQVNTTFMGMRSLNGVLFFVFMALLIWILRAQQSNIDIFYLAILGIPTYFFFVIHISNYTHLIAGFTATALCIFSILFSKPKPLTMFSLGVVTGIWLSSGRSAFVGLPVIGMMIFVFIVKGNLETSAKPKAVASIFGAWMMLFVGLTVMLFLSRDSFYFSEVAGMFNLDSKNLPYIPWLALLPLGLLTVISCRLVEKVREREYHKSLHFILGIPLAALLLFIWFWPLYQSYAMPDMERGDFKGPPWLGGLTFLRVFWSNVGLGGGYDFLTIASFWGGFGCPEAFFPQFVVNLFTLICYLPLSVYGLTSILKRQTSGILHCYFFLILLSAYAYALGYAGVHNGMSLHGRHVFGLHMLLLLVGVASTLLMIHFEPNKKELKLQWIRVSLIVFCLLVHSGASLRIFGRYF